MTVAPDNRGWGQPGHVPLETMRRGDGLILTVNAVLFDLVEMLLGLTEASGYHVKPGQTWGYNDRNVAGTNVKSTHAWGLAIDINAPANPRGSRGDIPDGVVEMWKAHDWAWGGDWKWTDPQHFEFVGSPDDAAAITARLRAFLSTPPPPPNRKKVDMFMLQDGRDDTVWLFGVGEPKSLGGRPDLYDRLLGRGIPSTPDDGALIDFLRS